MKPARFEYECPTDTAAAIALAARSDLMVKFIAGGQSLGPMLNLRLAQPDVLVDLTGIAELTQVEETADRCRSAPASPTPISRMAASRILRAGCCEALRAGLPTARCATAAPSGAVSPTPIRRPTGSRAWRRSAPAWSCAAHPGDARCRSRSSCSGLRDHPAERRARRSRYGAAVVEPGEVGIL